MTTMSKLVKMAFVISLGLFAACGGGDDRDDEDVTCVDAFICASDCEDNDCIEDCMNSGGATVRDQMIALATCSEESGCDAVEDVESCLRDKCGEELHECGL
jgi:hypothetical protein